MFCQDLCITSLNCSILLSVYDIYEGFKLTLLSMNLHFPVLKSFVSVFYTSFYVGFLHQINSAHSCHLVSTPDLTDFFFNIPLNQYDLVFPVAANICPTIPKRNDERRARAKLLFAPDCSAQTGPC